LKITIDSLGPWSYSKYKVLDRCPFWFYKKYIKKEKVPYIESPEALIGTAAHRILELFVKGYTLDVAFRDVKEEMKDKISQEIWVEKVETLELSIQTFKERFENFSNKNPIKRIYTEQRIGITKDFKPTTFFGDDVFFRGIVDLALHLDNGDAIFIDHKKGGNADYGLKNYNVQLDSQKVLFHYGIEKLAGATAGIHFIEAGQLKLGDYHDRDHIEHSLRRDLIFYIDSAVGKVLDYGYFKHIAGSYCSYCEFREPCKAGLLKEEEKKTKELVSYVQDDKGKG